jgi:hypothetical protein
MEAAMSQLTIVRKSKWRWITHVATFHSQHCLNVHVTVSSHTAQISINTGPIRHHYITKLRLITIKLRLSTITQAGVRTARPCGCGQCGCGQCGCGQCGCGQCAVSVQPPRVVIERRIVKHEYIERRYMDDCCQEQTRLPAAPHAVPPVYPSEYGQRSPFPYGYGGVRGQPSYGYYRQPWCRAIIGIEPRLRRMPAAMHPTAAVLANALRPLMGGDGELFLSKAVDAARPM